MNDLRTRLGLLLGLRDPTARSEDEVVRVIEEKLERIRYLEARCKDLEVNYPNMELVQIATHLLPQWREMPQSLANDERIIQDVVDMSQKLVDELHRRKAK